MTPLDRREFLVAAGSLVACGLAGCGRNGPPAGVLRRCKGGPLPGAIDYVPSVCMQCPAACGILVRRVQGVPVQIKGNPAYPTNAGGLCPKGVAGLQVLYDPDRIKGPLRRTAARGTGAWAEISWDEAIRTVVQRLAAIRKDPGPQAVVALGGRYQGGMETLMRRFLRCFGSPNHFSTGCSAADGTKLALEMLQGIHDHPVFDWEHTNYILSFGASLLETSRSAAYLLRSFGHLRRGRPGSRAKLVQIDTRLGVTGAKADEWVPIRPGTDAALALALAHVIVAEELQDADFATEHAFGLEDWEDEAGSHVGFARFVTENWAPERAADISGVPAETIVRLAREFATQGPAFAIADRGASMQSNGLYTSMAIHALNALVGSINRAGGVLIREESDLRPLPEPALDETARAGLLCERLDGAGTRRYPLAREVAQALPAAILDPAGPPVEACFLYGANPVFSHASGEEFQRAFERIPFLVSFSPFMDESTALADLVLPDHTYLERWQEVEVEGSLDRPVVGIRHPVTEPLYDTRHTGDVILEIARALGGSIAESHPWKRYRELMDYRIAGLHHVEGGSITGSPEPEFVSKVIRAGVWSAPARRPLAWEQVFRTPSGRFEFHSSALRAGLSAHLARGEEIDVLLAQLGVQARGDEALLPHYEPARFHGSAADYPLHLNGYEPLPDAGGRGANQPYLQEIMGVQLGEHWNTWLEINPRTARDLGVADGDMVWVESPRGRIQAKARHFAGARPDVVNIPFGGGHRSCGRWAEGIGANPNDILVPDEDRLGGQRAYLGTRVRVRRV